MGGRKGAAVRRITVDERLDEELVRILIARLKPGFELFGDAPGQWGDEEEALVSPRDYRRRFRAGARTPAWHELQEGRVYLSGAFELRGDPAAPDGFRRSAGCRAFERIDDMPQVKGAGKKLYARLLHREASHGTANKG